MGDMGDVFAGMRDDRQARHAEWFEKNMAALRAAGLLSRDRVTLQSSAVLFREYGRPKVDFYPHTGRWRVVGEGPDRRFRTGQRGEDGRTFRGGGEAFVRWYAKQKPEARRQTAAPGGTP
jgi:hypothetical protein